MTYNPISIKCPSCTVENPCSLCAEQIAAEAEYRAERLADVVHCVVAVRRAGNVAWCPVLRTLVAGEASALFLKEAGYSLDVIEESADEIGETLDTGSVFEAQPPDRATGDSWALYRTDSPHAETFTA